LVEFFPGSERAGRESDPRKKVLANNPRGGFGVKYQYG
jgi:hypothetical protein